MYIKNNSNQMKTSPVLIKHLGADKLSAQLLEWLIIIEDQNRKEKYLYLRTHIPLPGQVIHIEAKHTIFHLI